MSFLMCNWKSLFLWGVIQLCEEFPQLSSHVSIPVTQLNLFHFPPHLPPPPSCPSVTADLCALSVGPLLVAPSWHAVNRLGRGRSQCQLYWCRNGHTRRTGPESAAAAAPPPPPQLLNPQHTYTNIHAAATPKCMHTSINGPMPNRFGPTGT